MAGDVHEVYTKIHNITDKQELLMLELEYARKKDWFSAMVVSDALFPYVVSRDEFIALSKRHEKHQENYFTQLKAKL